MKTRLKDSFEIGMYYDGKKKGMSEENIEFCIEAYRKVLECIQK